VDKNGPYRVEGGIELIGVEIGLQGHQKSIMRFAGVVHLTTSHFATGRIFQSDLRMINGDPAVSFVMIK
jgi:hypothetical protein